MASGLEVADIFRRHGEAFRQAHAGHLGGVERRIMGAITACRTAVLGGHVEQCDDCGAIRIAYNSCRNRHCPKCQGLARAQWLVNGHRSFPDCGLSIFPSRRDWVWSVISRYRDRLSSLLAAGRGVLELAAGL